MRLRAEAGSDDPGVAAVDCEAAGLYGLEHAEELGPGLLNRRGIPHLAPAHDPDSIAVASVRDLKLAGLLDEPLLPWPCIVVAVRQLCARRQIGRRDPV